MDYFEVFNRLGIRHWGQRPSLQTEFAADSSPSAQYQPEANHTLMGYSDYNGSWSLKCDTALASRVTVLGKKHQKMSRVERLTTLDGTPIYTLIIPKGARVEIEGVPMDNGAQATGLGENLGKAITDRFVSSDFQPTVENQIRSSGAGGVQVRRYYYNYPQLTMEAIALSRAQSPQLYEASDLTVDEFLQRLEDITSDVVSRMSELERADPAHYQTLQKTFNLTTPNPTVSAVDGLTTFNTAGNYLLTLRYGYDAQSEKESLSAGWQMPASYYFASWGSALALEIAAALAGASVAKWLGKAAFGIRGALGAGGLRAAAKQAGISTTRYAFTTATIASALLVAEVGAFSVPWIVPAFTGATTSFNNCNFPASGHQHLFQIKVYDPAKQDAYGNPVCEAGYQRPLAQTYPPRFADVPCCPEGTSWSALRGTCVDSEGGTSDSNPPNALANNPRWLQDQPSNTSGFKGQEEVLLFGAGLLLMTALLKRRK